MLNDFDEEYGEMEAYFAFEEDFEHEYKQSRNRSKSNNNYQSCYIATCVYGSYDCPEVWTLRRFRDYTLAKTWHGRAFIHTYYALAPTLVKLFGDTKWFKTVWQSLLDRKVKALNDEGIENTPYQDIVW